LKGGGPAPGSGEICDCQKALKSRWGKTVNDEPSEMRRKGVPLGPQKGRSEEAKMNKVKCAIEKIYNFLQEKNKTDGRKTGCGEGRLETKRAPRRLKGNSQIWVGEEGSILLLRKFRKNRED